MHIVKYRDSAKRCAKMAEPIHMQSGKVSWAGPGNAYYMEI